MERKGKVSSIYLEGTSTLLYTQRQGVRWAEVSTEVETGNIYAQHVRTPYRTRKPESEAENLTQNEIYRLEGEFLEGINAHRAGLENTPAVHRLRVMDEAAGVQSRYLAETVPGTLTHVTDWDWLQANYPTEVQATGVQPSVRTRGRVAVGSFRETHNPNQSYGPDGQGCVEVLARGYGAPQQMLTALLASPYHKPALEDPDNIHVGVVISQEADTGRFVYSAVFGKGPGDNSTHEWQNTFRFERNHTVHLPIIKKSQ